MITTESEEVAAQNIIDLIPKLLKTITEHPCMGFAEAMTAAMQLQIALVMAEYPTNTARRREYYEAISPQLRVLDDMMIDAHKMRTN